MSKQNPSRLSVEEIIARVLQAGKLFFDGDFGYIKRDLYYERVDDENAKRYIVELLSETEKIATPKSDYQEALDRLRLLYRLQLHLSEKLKDQQHLVNVRNGVFNATTGKIEHKRDNYLFSYCCDFEYQPASTINLAPNFMRFLKTSVGDANTPCFLTCMGFLFSDIVDAKKAIFMVGDGNTGKSMICDIITDLVGKHAVCNTPFEKIGDQQSRHKFIGRKLSISRETNRAVLKNESAFKSVVSCETISGRRLYHEEVEFVSQLKLLVASNHPPTFSKLDEAILNRMVIVFFHSTLDEDDLDHELRSKLYGERDTIGSLCLDALHEFVISGYDFKMSPESKAYLNGCRIQLNSVEEFLTERCETAKDAAVSSADLWEAYQKFCAENGVDALGRNTFFQQVQWFFSGIKRDKADFGGRRLNAFIGIRFKQWTQPTANDEEKSPGHLGTTENET